MKNSPYGSSFSTTGDVDSMSERSSQSPYEGDADSMSERSSQSSPPTRDETSLFFQEQRLVLKLEEIADRLSAGLVGKESELARCVVELAQANGRLTAANERLTGQVNNLSLQLAAGTRHQHGAGVDLQSSNEQTILISLVATQVKNLQDSLQMASEERDELLQSVITLEHENSDLFLRLSNLVKEERAQLKSELSLLFSDAKNDCESSIADLNEEVPPRSTTTTPGPVVVQPVNQYVWKSSGDDVGVISGFHRVELLECPPIMTSLGVHKWSIFVVDEHHDASDYLRFLGVVSSVYSLERSSSSRRMGSYLLQLWKNISFWAVG